MKTKNYLPCWKPGLSPSEELDLAYAERNLLALRYADGWYYDLVQSPDAPDLKMPRYSGYKRVLSLDLGAITFHIPDDFNVGNLCEIEPNWDGHTTQEKWARVLKLRGMS